MFSRFLSAWLMCVSLAATADSGDLVRIGDLWRFQKLPAAASPPDRNWAQREFDDSRWRFAASGLQIVDEDVGLAPRGAPGYIFQRRAFTVRDPASIRALVLRVEHEEGYVAYLNGVEVARHQGRGIRYPTPEDIAAGMEDPLLTLGVHDLSEARSLLVEGENVLSVEGAYTGESASLLSLAATLTANFTRGPFIQNSTTGSVQIIWRTATPASSVVRYGLSPSLSQTAMSSELVTEHVVTLTGLAPDTKYFYQVCSTNSDDPEPMCGNVEWFRTLKSAGPITFAALGDSGDGSSAQSQIASVLRGLGAELVIHVGDLVYGGFSDATADTRIFNFYQPHMKNTPFFCTPGNHEHNCCGGIDDRGITNYQNVFYLPTNSGTEHFYSFDHGDAHFVSLYNPWFANYVFTNESPQFMWLTNDLAMSNKKWKFLFFHSPAAHSGLHAGRDNDNNGVPDQTQVIELLLPAAVTYGVQLIFAGHDHNFEKFAPSNGVHNVVTGGGGHSSLYNLTTRNIATAQHRPIHHCLKVTIEGDVLTVAALSTRGTYIDGFVVNRALPADIIYNSTWQTPVLETEPANNSDGNIRGQAFDFAGERVLPRHGQFANLGEFYVNNDSTNLYLGFRNAMFYRDNNIFLFVESPHLTGVTSMAGLGNGVIDPAVQGADGLDCLENLSFSGFAPTIGCILGDEFADSTDPAFARANLPLAIGQGVFRLNSDLTPIADARLQQFNRSPETNSVANDTSADFIEVAIPFGALGEAQPGDIIRVAAIAAGPDFDASAQTRQLDTAALGTSLTGSGKDPVILGAIRVRLAYPPTLDTDGDGLLDNWEIAYGLNPNSDSGMHGAGADPDEDGHTNGQEQIAGTDPRDRNSVLRLSLTPIDSTFFRVSWKSVPGRAYQLEHADDQIGSFADFMGTNWPRIAISGEEIYEDDLSADPPLLLRAYRVRLAP